MSAHPPPSMDSECPVRPGDVLAGKYRVERVLGMGGMGIVVAARHEQLQQLVALKFVLAGSEPAAVERFIREARAAVRLKSEHVAKVLDVGTLETGTPYIVMEYLEGSDLCSVLRERGSLPVEVAVDYVLQACEALTEAHTLGIIHRDLKPGNLFLTTRVDGRALVKVLDFGISKTLSDGSGPPSVHLTRTNSAMGSPLYMAPEQMRSARNVDARSDVWALGVVLYELLSGGPPFKGGSIPEICLKAVSEAADPIGRSDVPTDLESIVEKCMAKDPGGRYSTVAELALALAPFAPAGLSSAASCQKIAIEGRKHERTVEAFISPSTAVLGVGIPSPYPPQRTPFPVYGPPHTPMASSSSHPPQPLTPAAWIQRPPPPKPAPRDGMAGRAVAFICGASVLAALAFWAFKKPANVNEVAPTDTVATRVTASPAPTGVVSPSAGPTGVAVVPSESVTTTGASGLTPLEPANTGQRVAIPPRNPVGRPSPSEPIPAETGRTATPNGSVSTKPPPKPVPADDGIPSVR